MGRHTLIYELVMFYLKPLSEIKEDEIPFDIPESWEWVRLNDCMECLRQGAAG